MITNNSAFQIILGSRVFTARDQKEFAIFSGDCNPIHIDPIYARRTISGQCVVHGIHGLMWALDALISIKNIYPSEISVTFLKPIFLDEKVTCCYFENTNKVQISNESTILYEIKLKFSSKIQVNNLPLRFKKTLDAPLHLDIGQMRKLGPQEFFFRGNSILAKTLFPNIAKVYGVSSCSEIAAMSEIIGMQVPGLNSLFFSAYIRFRQSTSERNFFIEAVDERFNLVKVILHATSLECEIQAFIRPQPTYGLPIFSLESKVNPAEFKNIKALIIGGSRGLGESTAKLIAAGGGESTITYSSGMEDCLNIKKQILEFGRVCSIKKLTIPDDIHFLDNIQNINQIYYFPTPKIFGRRCFKYSVSSYQNFYKIYVDGFRMVINKVANRDKKITIFYPSSDAINSPLIELSEYIDAKIAGEKLCEKLNTIPGISILTERIPRIKTDQTMSITAIPSHNPEDIMLPIIRKMSNLC